MKPVAVAACSLAGLLALAIALFVPPAASQLPPPSTYRINAGSPTYAAVGATGDSRVASAWFVATGIDGVQYPVACTIAVAGNPEEVKCARGAFPK